MDIDDLTFNLINEMIDNNIIVGNAVNSDRFPHALTLNRLSEMAESFKKEFPVLPKYYRVNQRTYDALKKTLVSQAAPNNFVRKLISIEIRIDQTVPDGEAWPPEKSS